MKGQERMGNNLHRGHRVQRHQSRWRGEHRVDQSRQDSVWVLFACTSLWPVSFLVVEHKGLRRYQKVRHGLSRRVFCDIIIYHLPTMSTPPLTSTSRPQSGYEDLSLDDDTSTDTRRQPSTNNSSSSPSNSTSRYSATPSVSRSSIAPSLSALDTRPKLKSFASSSSAGSSGGGGSFGGGGGGGGINGIGTSSTGKLAGDGRKVQQRPVPLVLGVAVVDFNHLVGDHFTHVLESSKMSKNEDVDWSSGRTYSRVRSPSLLTLCIIR